MPDSQLAISPKILARRTRSPGVHRRDSVAREDDRHETNPWLSSATRVQVLQEYWVDCFNFEALGKGRTGRFAEGLKHSWVLVVGGIHKSQQGVHEHGVRGELGLHRIAPARVRQPRKTRGVKRQGGCA